MNYKIIRIASIFGLVSVMLGAFGAHALRDHLEPRDLETFHTATTYQMYHSLVLLGAGILGFKKPALFFIIGMIIFSGSLYLLVATGQRWLGAITPLGGISLMLGWGGMAWNAAKHR